MTDIYGMPEIGDFVRVSDTITGEITAIICDRAGVPEMVVVRESANRWHNIRIGELEPIVPS